MVKRNVLFLKLLAPYFAVGIFWFGFSSAWLAILAYHAQILFWSRGKIRGLATGMFRPDRRSLLSYALPFVLAGPAMYFLIPHITRVDLPLWLAGHRLTGLSLWLMIPYYGIVHPILEQLHWAGLRDETPLAHPVFAGYHLLVLYSLLPFIYLVASFIVLMSVSFAWKKIDKVTGDRRATVLSHMLADLGLGIAALMRSWV